MRLPLILFLVFSQFTIFAQKDTLSTDAIWPLGLAIHNDLLYIAESDNDQISTLDLNDENAILQPFIVDLDVPFFLEVDGDMLYFTETSLGIIYKVDLTDQNPNPQVVLSNLGNPKSVLVIDNFLYFSEVGQISRINLDEENPNIEIIQSDLLAFVNLATDGEYLYYSEYGGDRISKINLNSIFSDPEPILSGLQAPLGGITIVDDFLFYFEYDATIISYINTKIEGASPVRLDIEVVYGDLVAKDNFLYVSDFRNDLILRYRFRELNTSTSTEETLESEILLYPNPAHNFIHLTKSKDLENCFITSSSGKLVMNNINSINNQIDITQLDPGIYFLIFEDGEKYKFTKL